VIILCSFRYYRLLDNSQGVEFRSLADPTSVIDSPRTIICPVSTIVGVNASRRTGDRGENGRETRLVPRIEGIRGGYLRLREFSSAAMYQDLGNKAYSALDVLNGRFFY
jgi:hypothetical protein